MTRPTVGKMDVLATDAIDVTFGGFGVGPYRVPYMSTVLSVAQVGDYLNLVAEDPKYQAQAWTVEELFQRELNLARVNDIVENYLNDARARRPAFFNSLTVVLHSAVEEPIAKAPAKPPESSQAYPDQLLIGPIRIDWNSGNGQLQVPPAGAFASLCWNKAQVYAVAIDGQHRLAALKRVPPTSAAAKNSSVSVLILVLDPRVGFKGDPGADPVTMMRSIFIDLNKHAQPVSRARNLLLDDRDPLAACVRATIGRSLELQIRQPETIGPLGFPVGENDEFDSRLPLELIDWHGEQKSKVDRGPYATSILALEWAIREVLKSRYLGVKGRIEDLFELTPDDDGYYDAIRQVLSTWPIVEIAASERIAKAEDAGTPFILEITDCQRIARAFEETWGRALTRLLVTLGPYRILAQKRLKKNTLTAVFGLWSQSRSALESFRNSPEAVVQEYRDRFASTCKMVEEQGQSPNALATFVANDIERDVKGADDAHPEKANLLFFLTGQRSLVIALKKLVQARKADDWALALGQELLFQARGVQDFCSWMLCEALSNWSALSAGVFTKGATVRRHDEPLTGNFASRFWAAAILDRSDPDIVDFTGMGAKRASEWMVFLTFWHWLAILSPDISPTLLRKVVSGDDKARSDLEGLPFGKEWVRALDAVMGVGSLLAGPNEANNYPIAFLARTQRDLATDDHIRALMRDRLDFLIRARKQSNAE